MDIAIKPQFFFPLARFLLLQWHLQFRFVDLKTTKHGNGKGQMRFNGVLSGIVQGHSFPGRFL